MFRRKTHLEKLAERQEAAEFDGRYDDDSGGIMAFIRSRGSRETFESILVAIVLALLFRNFLGEAYIIPTGSMATVLQGRHMDIECDECGYQYRTGASAENVISGRSAGEVTATACPICQNITQLERRKRRDHRSFAGDRILVNKFVYDFQSPKRWDVIVFKYPNNGKQNYIKRCVGIPGEGLLIESGDIFTYNLATETFEDRQVARKDHRKLRAMLHLVDDTKFVANKLKAVGWPSRWQQWDTQPATWQVEDKEDSTVFVNAGTESDLQWLRYRHLRPRIDRHGANGRTISEWETIRIGKSPKRLSSDKGELIADHYAYNESIEVGALSVDLQRRSINTLGLSGLHWVGDLGVECEFEVASDKGTLAFDVVEGGVHFTCKVNIENGEASLLTSGNDSNIQFVDSENTGVATLPTAKTPIAGPGKYSIRFVNADNKLYFWVNDIPIEFAVSEYQRDEDVRPKWTPEDPFDAEPIGIGSAGVDITVNRIKVLRDVYYVSGNKDFHKNISNEYIVTLPHAPTSQTPHPNEVLRILRDPESWSGEQAEKLFGSRKRDEKWVFILNKYPNEPGKDEFMPMGDNSPQSSDARVWNGPPHVDREYLLGRAMFVYWPHAKIKPLPFWPNFERMKLIR